MRPSQRRSDILTALEGSVDEDKVTREVVEAARDNLVIGAA